MQCSLFIAARGDSRLINLICEHAMITAYVEQMKPIPSCIVESVCSELELLQPPLLIPPAAPAGLPENASSTKIFDPASHGECYRFYEGT